MKATTAPAQSFNGSPDRLESVDNYIMQGLQDRFLSVFNTPTVWCTSTDKVKAVDKIFADTGGKVTYPYAALVLNSWQRADDRMSLRVASMRGVRVAISTDARTTQKARIIPMDFSVSIEWYFNSFKDMKDTARRWLFIQQKGSLNFQVQYGETYFDIKTLPDTSVNFPKREADPDNVQEYVLETNLVIQGVISEVETTQQQVIDSVEGEAVTSLPSSESTTLWQFKSRPPR